MSVDQRANLIASLRLFIAESGGVVAPSATIELTDAFIAMIVAMIGEMSAEKGGRGLTEKGPELIQGYTAEQWQEIIDGGYLCEFSFSTDFDRVYSSLLSDHGHDEHEGTHYFHPVNDKTNDFQYCRPAQIKGVMRPIFVEPVGGDAAACQFFNEYGTALNHGIASMYGGSMDNGATRYIEL